MDEDGQPVAGAEVTAAGRAEPVRTTTGDSGGFALEVDTGTWRVSARRGATRWDTSPRPCPWRRERRCVASR